MLHKIKLKFLRGEPLSVKELKYFTSELNQLTRDELADLMPLFSSEELAHAPSGIDDLYADDIAGSGASVLLWCPDVEAELLEFFRTNPELMTSMPPRRFEELVAAIFRNNGFYVELTPESRDNGVDIIAVERSALTGESVHLIECKRYAPDRPVGIGVVQRLLGVVTHMRATKGVIVTTSHFTSPARSLASNSRHVLTLRDYEALTFWLQNLPQASRHR
jgi:restriction system protein